MSKSHLINANIHRAKEGARVLEDIARFFLKDPILFQKIRSVRHAIQMKEPSYDIKKDVGGVNLIENNVRDNVTTIISANAARLQEALRVLEEMSSLSEDKQHLKTLRYEAYDLYAKLFHHTKKYQQINLLKGLYLIIDMDIIKYPLDKILNIINQSPIHIVQYRNKFAEKKIFVEQAYYIKQQLAPHKLLIINDHIDVALDIADGIHIGQKDYPLERIFNIIPDDFIIGISCHNSKEAHIAVQYPISYLAIGCLFSTQSKNDVLPVSIETLQQVCKDLSLPTCAIGGINIHNLDQVLSANIKMAALISYVWKTENPLQTINTMHKKIMKHTASKN